MLVNTVVLLAIKADKTKTYIDCSFAAGDACGFESFHSDDSFRFEISPFQRRMVAIDRGSYPLPWYRDAHLWSPLQPMTPGSAVGRTTSCLDVEIAYQIRGDAFLRVGLILTSESEMVHQRPFDDHYFVGVQNRSAKVKDGVRKAEEWAYLRGSVPAPQEGFQLVIHAGVNFTSYRVVGVVQLKSVIVRKVSCAVGVDRKAPTRLPRPKLALCSPRARSERFCDNGGQCFQLARRGATESAPFCRCVSPWIGPSCSDRGSWSEPASTTPKPLPTRTEPVSTLSILSQKPASLAVPTKYVSDAKESQGRFDSSVRRKALAVSSSVLHI